MCRQFTRRLSLIHVEQIQEKHPILDRHDEKKTPQWKEHEPLIEEAFRTSRETNRRGQKRTCGAQQEKQYPLLNRILSMVRKTSEKRT